MRTANQAKMPLVYLLSMLGPLYQGVIQPSDRVTRQTSRFWLANTCHPYDDKDDPTNTCLRPSSAIRFPAAIGIIVAVATGDVAAAASAPAAGTAAAALGAYGHEALLPPPVVTRR